MNQPGIIFGLEANSLQHNWKVPQPEDLPYLTGVKRIGMDCETSGKNPFKHKVVGISIAYRTEVFDMKRLYCPVAHASGNMDPEVVRNWFNYVLPGKEVVFANGKFDIPFLKSFGVDLEKLGVKPHDVAFPDALLDDNRISGRDLETLGLRYVGRGKAQFLGDKNKMESYPSYLVGPYAEEDSSLALEVDEACVPFIKREGLEKVLALENSLIYTVCEIERNGCRIDVEKLERWRVEVQNELHRTLELLHKQTGLLVQPGSGSSIAELFSNLGIKPPAREVKKKKGQTKKEFEGEQKAAKKSRTRFLSFGEDTFEVDAETPTYEVDELVALKHPSIDLVVKARRLESLKSKFLDKYSEGLDGDILRAQFHQLKGDEGGTVGGRFSSAGGDENSGYSFNAQQVIKTKLQQETLGDKWIIRELFIPDEGMEYWSSDLSQVEYRIATHFSGSEKIIAAYKDPKADFHATTQALIQRYRPEFNDRTKTKNVNFAFVFGSGVDTLAATAGISKKDASEVLDILTREAPEFPKLLERLKNQAESQGYVQTLYGRRARFGTHEKRFYAALNRVVQGSAADIFKVYLLSLYNEQTTLGITKLRQVVHDEANGDKQPGEIYKKRLQEFLNDQKVQLKVPILWELRTGANWKECH